MAVLQVNDIHKSFGRTEVLKGISFSLEKGQVLSIIGSSGSGKTTLLRCLNFLETPHRGSIVVNGETLFDARNPDSGSAENIRRKRLHFGLVFQSFNLFPQYNVTENLSLAVELLAKESLKNTGSFRGATNMKQAKDLIRTQSEELLAKVGLSEKADFYPHQLSGGQQQRVAIARALALTPDILCFDEPTSALDPELTGEVLNVIRSLKSAESTMIVVTHEIAFAHDVSDRVIFMSDGLVVEEGTPEEVIDRPQNPRTQAFLNRIHG